ncbi:MAG: glucose-6-phosphate dehydrogenase [Calditrichia bacterium]
MESTLENCTVVIFGASGDLTKRKLIPALFSLYKLNLMPEKWRILGLARTDWKDADFQKAMRAGLDEFAGDGDKELKDTFIKSLAYEAMDFMDDKAYANVKKRLDKFDSEDGIGSNIMFYLSVPPSIFLPIAEHLAHQKLNIQEEGKFWRRIIVEKPFGYNLETAMELNAGLQSCFRERQIYRIDHYLGKETVQNVMALRFSNGIFEPLWNRNYIEYVEITAAESIGIGSRGGYFDRSGTLRDMVQNHLMQVLGMIAMEPPSSFRADNVRNETVKVFHSLRHYSPEDVSKYVIRGQYMSSKLNGERVNGYREEVGVADDSRTETYVALKAYVDNWRWKNVPFLIRSGKRLPTRVTEVVIHFKETPHDIFQEGGTPGVSGNQLIIRIQPDEGLLMKFGMKMPGSGFDIKTVGMDFHYADLSKKRIPQAYERLLHDCIVGDSTLYARSDAVEASWRFVKPIQDAWAERPQIPVYGYASGKWGPDVARTLLEPPAFDWRYPCANLVEESGYTEL